MIRMGGEWSGGLGFNFRLSILLLLVAICTRLAKKNAAQLCLDDDLSFTEAVHIQLAAMGIGNAHPERPHD
jgi:hypothetical protein